MSTQTPAITISSLPNELLAAIAAAGQLRTRVPGLLPDAPSEWTLSHVSHRFRRVMISSSALWTLLEVDLHSEGSVGILGLYLERSQNYSLAVTLQHRSELREDSERELVTKRLSQLVLHINRISWLRIAVQEWGGDLLLAPFRDLAAPILQHLEVVNLIDYYHWGPITLFLAGAPRIRFLKVYDQRLRLPGPQWMSSLTHLELRRYHRLGAVEDQGDKSFDKVLAQCSSLTCLYLDMEGVPLDRRVKISSLQSLYITISESHNLAEIIDIFDTPSLTEFTIMGVHGLDIFEFFNSTRLPRTSFPSLASLCFVENDRRPCYCEYNKMPFPQGPCPPFRLFPALSSISLINVCFMSRIVKGVVPASATCSVLQTIALSPRTAATEDVRSAVLDAIHSYLQYGWPLPTLRLSPALASCEDWQKHGIAVDKFDPADIHQVFLASKLKYA
ncbi:hypothetical protein C8R45DRAFT_987163 [Mycena sanguinolenta]|nr:hypothetical protein C8R45DRAFT_987163 [Mycena sanguinolenta]